MATKERSRTQLKLDLKTKSTPLIPAERRADLSKALGELLLGVARTRNGQLERRSTHEVTQADS